MRQVFTSLGLLFGRVIGVTKGPVATTLYDHSTGVANAGTTETDLYADPVPPDALANVGDKVEARYGGVVNTSTSAVRLRLYFAGTVVYDTAAITFAVSGWAFYVTVMRTGPGECRCMVTLASAPATTIPPARVTELAGVNFAVPQTLKVTGQSAGATGDIIAKLGYAEYKPRATP